MCNHGYTEESLAKAVDKTCPPLDAVENLLNPHWGRRVGRKYIQTVADLLELKPEDFVDPHLWNWQPSAGASKLKKTTFTTERQVYDSRLEEQELSQQASELGLVHTPLELLHFQQQGLQEYDETRVQTLELRQSKATKAIPAEVRNSEIPKLVGREPELKRLHELVEQNDWITIVGSPGLGKTELAIEYAQRHRQLQTYEGGICWLDAKRGDIGNQLVAFTRKYFATFTIPKELAFTDQVNVCWHHWIEGNVLLIIDDVTDYEEKIKPYLECKPSRFKVLITTQEHIGTPFVSLVLDVLKQDAAMELLASLIGRERLEKELSAAGELCRRLGYLPLALNSIGRDLAQDEGLLLDRTLSQLQNTKWLKPKTFIQADVRMTSRLRIFAAFEVSWQRLDVKAQALACLLSLFALSPIPWSLVERVVWECYVKQVKDAVQDSVKILGWQKLKEWMKENWISMVIGFSEYDWKETLRYNQELQEEIENFQEELENSRIYLRRFHLIHYAEKQTYRLPHQLMRDFLRQKLEELMDAETIKQVFVMMMAEIAKGIPNFLTSQQIEALLPYIPHVQEVTSGDWIDVLTDEDLFAPFQGLGNFYEAQGCFIQASTWRKQCLSVTTRRFGSNNIYVAHSLKELAIIYGKLDRFQEGIDCYQQALKIERHFFGESHIYIAVGLNQVGVFLGYLGLWQDAKDLYQKAFDQRKRKLGGNPALIMNLLNNLAQSFYQCGHYKRAERVQLQVLERKKRLWGERHQFLAVTWSNLAWIYNAQCKYKKAEPAFLESLNLNKLWLPKNHPDVANSQHNLAYFYDLQGRHSEAEPLHTEAVAILEQQFGIEHNRSVRYRKALEDCRAAMQKTKSTKRPMTALGEYHRLTLKEKKN
jgi:tetratricopeptide (TPR) repeat protein